MARIRTIKPDFWTDPGITALSMAARLLFIGMWNFADDKGNLEAHPGKIKAQVFPSDNIQVEPLIGELVKGNFVLQYEREEKTYLHIRTFLKHQKIDRPSKFALCPPFDEPQGGWPECEGDSGRIRRGFGEGSAGEGNVGEVSEFRGKDSKGKEGNRKEMEKFDNNFELLEEANRKLHKKREELGIE